MASWVALSRSKFRKQWWSALGWQGRSIASWEDVSSLFAAIFLILGLSGLTLGSSDQPLALARDIVLVVDVSRSMAAEDAIPDRLTVAKKAAESLITELNLEPDSRMGLIAFAGRAVVRSPLTQNLGAVRQAITRLVPGSVQPGGSDLGGGIRAALQLLRAGSGDPGGSILVLSDGEDLENAWSSAVQQALSARVPVHTIAIGDATQTTTIPCRTRSSRSDKPDFVLEPLKYQGQVVQTRREDAALEAISKRTGGSFLAMGRTTIELGFLNREVYRPIARQVEGRIQRDRQATYVPWAGLCALLSLLLLPLSRNVPAKTRWVWVIVLVISQVAANRPGDPGLDSYRSGRWQEALLYYQSTLAFKAREPVALFNAAACAYQMGQFELSEGWYEEVTLHTSGLLGLKSRFGKANALVGLKNVDQAMRTYRECLTDQTPGLEAAQVRSNAKANLDFLVRLQDQDSGKKENSGEGSSEDKPGKNSAKSSSSKPSNLQAITGGLDEGQTRPGTREQDGVEKTGPSSSISQELAPGLTLSPRQRWQKAIGAVERGRNRPFVASSGSSANVEDRDW